MGVDIDMGAMISAGLPLLKIDKNIWQIFFP